MKKVFKTDFMLCISEIKLGPIVVHTADWEVKLIIFEKNISLLFRVKIQFFYTLSFI